MRRLAVLVGAVILVETMFYAAIVPLLPELAERLDLGKNGAGVLTGAYATGTLLGALPAGWLAARIGVKPTMIAGLGLLTVAGLAFAFGDSIVVLDAARFVQGLAGACAWASGMTWLAATAPYERRGIVLGSAMGAAVFGVQLGPLLGALATWVGQEAAFSSVVAFTALLGVFAWATPGPTVRADRPAKPTAALRERRMLAGMWLTALPGAAFGVVDVLAPLRLDALGAGALAVGLTFFLAAGAEAVVNPAVGRLSDRRGTRRLVRVGLFASAAGLLVLPLPGTVPALAVAIIAVAAVLGALWVPAMKLLTEGAERIGLDHGFAFGWFNLAWAGGFAIGSTAGGALAEVSGDAAVYAIAAGLYLVTVAGAVVVERPGRQAAGAATGG
jgi:predicted MFS family arabinose efflux permease